MSSSSFRRRIAVVAAVLALGACGDDGTKPDPLTLTLSSTSVTVEELETVPLSAEVGGPSGAVVSWTSSNADVATVDAQGRVTGVAAGSATVTATATVGGESAQGSVAVNVTPLPLAVAITGFVDGAGPVPADALGLGVSAQVTYDVPANFQGSIEILAGDAVLGRVDVPDPSAAGPSAASEVVVTALRAARSDVPLSVTALRDGAIEPLVANDVATALTARLANLSGTASQSGSTTASFRVPRLLGLTSIDASRSATDALGRTWVGGPDPLIVVNGRIVDADALPVDPSGIASITVLKDASATALYGTAATNGVVLIQLRNELAGQEGEFTFGSTATVDAFGGTVPLLNADDIAASDLGLATGFLYDGAAPSVPFVAFTENAWFKPGEIWPQLTERFGFDASDFVDGGVGGVSVDLRVGTTPDLELGSIQAFDDAYVALAAGWFLGVDVTDDLDNFRQWVFAQQGTPMRIGVDPTPPDAPVFRVGANFTPAGVVNPGLLHFGWDADDAQPGSGIDLGGWRLSLEYASPTGSDCLLGLGTDCAPVPGPAGAHDGWSPEGVPSGLSAEFTLGVGATDFARHFGDLSRIRWATDVAAPQGSGTPAVGTPSNGDLPLSGFQLVDDLELAFTAVVAQYSTGAQVPINPMVLASQAVGTLFDGTFHTAAPEMVYMPHLVSLETTEAAFPNRPTGTIHPLAAVTVLGGDHAAHTATVSTTAPGVAPRGTSFLTAGMDHFAFRTAPGTICNPTPSNGAGCNGAPTSVDVVVEAFTSGQFEITEVMLVATQSDPGNPVGLADWTDLVVVDRGSFREGTATFTLDAADLGLSGGFLDLWAMARDGNGGGVLSQKARYTVVF